MMLSRGLLCCLLTPAIALLLISCSQDPSDELATSEPETAEQSAKLLDLPRPNPASMQADVAALLSSSWQQLNNTLNEPELSAEVRAEAYANYGLVAFGNGLSLPAETAFENAARLAPGEARWVYFLALMHQYNGKLIEAASSLQRVLELRQNDLSALIRLGNVRFEQAYMQDAQDLYQRALKVDTTSAAARYGLGQVASAQGKHQEAVSHFESALAQQPNADRINYFLGLAWRNLGDAVKAKAYLAKHGSNEPSFTDPLFDEISGGESRIEGLWAHMNTGSQAFVDGNYALAVDEFHLATADLPDDQRSWQSLGMALNKTNDNEGAKTAYLKALALAKNNAVVHHEIAKLLIQTREFDAAEQHLLQAVEIDSRMLAAQQTLARLLASTGRQAQALKRYDEALTLDPQSGEIAIARAETLVALERLDDAIVALTEAVRINPRDANLKIAYGLVLADADRGDAAMTEIKQALEFASDDKARARAHYALAKVHLRQGNADGAISSLGDALKLNPQHRGAGLELARTFLRLRNYKQSLATYEVHIGLWPQIDATRVEAARVAVVLGDGAKARRLLEDGASRESASARLLGSLARLMVLSTEPKVRDVDLALQHAQRALKIKSAPQHNETLALCYAAKGDFSSAVTLQQRLLEQAEPKVTARVRTRMRKNLERYRGKSLGRLPFDAS